MPCHTTPQLSHQSALLQQLHTAERGSLLAEIAQLRSLLEDMRLEQRQLHQALVERLTQAGRDGSPVTEQLSALLAAPQLGLSEIESVLRGKDEELGRLELTIAGLEQEKLALELRLQEAEASLRELEVSMEKASTTMTTLQQVRELGRGGRG